MSFGRLEKPRGNQPMSDINVTPLVDVMLVLLVIFIITAPLMTSQLALELPKSAEPVAEKSQEPEAFVSINIDAQGQVYWDQEPVDAAGLRERLKQVALKNPATELQLRADTNVPYGRVVQLIGMAQAVGLSRMGFVADPVTGDPLPGETRKP
ncbi:biopolymer transporter ExbD [Hydrogenophaga sp. PAMC20947]|uniref:ExbD/TolR family protein n=1 Tax=Hydrogenophaga sp. PAMC20947 TaxID=2565558 RepID=UPI00109DBCCD|nr:biopolymer transporter ExbD [Hydrogenophaga sp. PAMC20947]QCB47988.1 biopolymer transporter ExbD [Hydrogenophaga sp. PAMC20947]